MGHGRVVDLEHTLSHIQREIRLPLRHPKNNSTLSGRYRHTPLIPF